MKIMTFYLDEETYAVELSAVAAVARGDVGGAPRAGAGRRALAADGAALRADVAGAEASAGTSVADHAPAGVGVTGEPSSAFDLAGALGLGGGGAAAAEGAVLVLRGEGGRAVGVWVERLGEVVEVGAEGVRGVPVYFDSPLLRGVVALGEGWAVLLDAGAVIRAATGEGVAAAGRGEGRS